jgi:hypothetical protein
MNSEQYKEHINDIKELKQHIIVIEKSLQKFRISFLHHKYKEKDELKELLISFLQDLPNFIIIEMHNMRDINRNCPSYEICPKIDDALINTIIIAEKQTKYYMEIHWLTLCYPDIQKIMELYSKIEDVLIHTILIKEKKLKCYENIMELYPEKKLTELYSESNCEKPVIEKKQFSMSASLIFMIMIVFYVITVTTVVLVVNYNYNYNTDVMHHSMQCSQSTRLIDKHNKLADKDIMII